MIYDVADGEGLADHNSYHSYPNINLSFFRNFCPCLSLPLQVLLQVLCSQDHLAAGHNQIEAGEIRYLRYDLPQLVRVDI